MHTSDDRASRHAWFKSVILPHESSLRGWLRRSVRSRDVDIDDVVAESLVRAYQYKDFTRIDRGRAFLFTIARHLLIDQARQRSVVSFDFVADLEALAVPDDANSPEVIAVARDELRQLQSVIEALPARCREVFVLRRIDDLSMAEIADRLGLSVSTVEKHLAKAIALVTRGLAAAGAVEPRGSMHRGADRRVADEFGD
ncbi:MAG TPA: RNA polymerase sigma factor [Steroidobacteraceae bacterium]|nr:RNA polymerase sigma factor [Steroidobacteraceae bacterium]